MEEISLFVSICYPYSVFWEAERDKATLGVISEEIREGVSEETLRYYRIALGLVEPEERNSSNFP